MTRGMQLASPAIEGKTIMTSLGSILTAAVIAGLIAGAVASGFHALLIEPVIDRAIELEEQRSQARGEAVNEPVIDRPTQRWGLLIGFLLYGAIWGLLFGLLSHSTQTWQPSVWTPGRCSFLLVLLVGWSVAVFPFLKYPANPPGVGETETISYRQGLYFGFIALSVAGSALAVWLQRLLNRPTRPTAMGRGHWLLALAFYVVYAAVVYVIMPANPDPVEMPAQLVWTFRAISLGGLILFWGALGGAFVWLSREPAFALRWRRTT